MIYLQSERLRVEVCEPNEAPNTTLRFDRAGFISEVTLDGQTRFCATEPNNLWHPSSGGRGLCSELLCDVSEEFKLDEMFPKLGVGLLKKTENEPYCFYKKYEHKLFPVSVDASEMAAVFKTSAIPCGGYAAEQEKQIEVQGNTLILAMKVTNVGEKSLHIQEYCHNFFSIGGMAVGDAYTVDLPGVKAIEIGNLKSSLGVDNYRGTPTGVQIAGYSNQYATLQFEPTQIGNELPFRWKLNNIAAKASISCEESFHPNSVAIWSVDHMVSPEVFYSFTLQPHQSISWKRAYTFDRVN